MKSELKGSTLIGGAGENERQHLDHYPTPENVTHALMQFLHDRGNFYFDRKLNIWEPACGNGAMSKVIETYGHNVISSDIGNYGYGVTGVDYLAHSSCYDVDAIITNPPFNISQQFIELATQNTPVVCMLLKSQYWHAKSRFLLFNKTKPQFVLPLTWRPDFMEHTRRMGDKKAAPTMDVAWTVWIKGSNLDAVYIPLSKPVLTTD